MPVIDDTYRTIASKSEGLYKEKGSKFIALAYPVRSEEEVKEILAKLRRDYHDARHHCYAYVIGAKGEHWRTNDDGEPSGTAGKPIHGQIVSKGVTNVLVVVIRYFGGTKLGVSGLINAYKASAQDALNNAEIATRTVDNVYRVNFSYLAMNDVMKLVKDEDLIIIEQNFDTSCSMVIKVRQSKSHIVSKRVEKIDSASINYLRTE